MIFYCWAYDVDGVVCVVSFKGAQFPRDVLLYAVFFYVRYPLSYRDLEAIPAERCITVDHATLNRWVVKYASTLAEIAQKRKAPKASSWRLDETYVKVRGDWCYPLPGSAFGRNVAKEVPGCAINKSGANTAGLEGMNAALRDVGSSRRIRVYRSKYLNNIVEQDHRGLKRRTRGMMGLKSLRSAAAALDGIETAHMTRKGQPGQGCPFAIYAGLAA